MKKMKKVKILKFSFNLLALILSLSVGRSLTLADTPVVSQEAALQTENDADKKGEAEKLKKDYQDYVKASLLDSENEIEKQKAKYPGMAKYLRCRTPFAKVETFKEQAKKLHDSFNKFVEKFNETGRPDEEFEEYVREFIKGSKDEDKPNFLNRVDFEKYVNENNAKRLYRGIDQKQFLDDFRNGNVFVGGSIKGPFFSDEYGSLYGHCVYTTVSKDVAQNFAKKFQKNEKTKTKWSIMGGVVEMAVNENELKVINNDDLDCIIAALQFYFPCNLDLDFFQHPGLLKTYMCSKHYKLFEDSFREAFGFDLKELADHLNPGWQQLPYKEKSDFIVYLNRFLEQKVQKNQKFSELFDEKIKNNNEPPAIMNKELFLRQDLGLCAKLLGYDVIVDDHGRNARGNIGNDDTYWLVVNPKILTICSEADYDEENKSLEGLWSEFMDMVKKEKEEEDS